MRGTFRGGEMNHNFRLFAAAIGVVVGLTWSAGAVENPPYIPIEYFNNLPSGWERDSGVVVSSDPVVHDGNWLKIPFLNTVRVVNTHDTSSGLVWTDFWTKPFRCSVAPNIDPSATAQVFVNAGGHWSTQSGVGGAVQEHINSKLDLTEVVLDSNWHHVSVLHNYKNQTWSLYVDDKPMATDLGFITADNNASNDKWFKVTSLGGASETALDDFLVKDSIPASLAAPGTAPGTVNGVTPAVALTYFGVIGDPRPAPTAIGLVADQMNLQFTANPGLQYKLIGGSSPDVASMLDRSGLVDGDGISSLTDSQALSGNMGFYKILTVSPVDGTVVLTNSQTYAWYKQYRLTTSRWYYSGVPVSYINSGDNRLDSVAGQQLLQGLAGGASVSADQLSYGGDSTFFHNGTTWERYGSSGAFPDQVSLRPGEGVAILRKEEPASTDKAIISGLWTASVLPIPLKNGWNSLVRPFDTPATLVLVKNGFPSSLDDKFIVQHGASGGTLIAKYNGTSWVKINNQPLVAADWPVAGEGFLYYNTAADNVKSYSPTR